MPIDADMKRNHQTLIETGGFLRRSDRGLIEITGQDRQDWLHNLVTNVVRTLAPGDGNYAFAVTLQGRTLFDLNILVLDYACLLDIDRRWIESAMTHLVKSLVVEDQKLTDVTDAWDRFAVLGPRTADLVDALGLGNNFTALADLQHVAGQVEQSPVRLVKNNLGRVPRAEIIVPVERSEDFALLLAARAAKLGMIEIDTSLAEIVRIEAGVPASVVDIDDQVIPPETLQTERGISYSKGCYLGQEVIERMRSRDSMAKRLVGMRIEGEELPPHNAAIHIGDREIGRVTSACRSVVLDGVLALGYVKTRFVEDDSQLVVALDEERNVNGRLIELPV